MAGHFFQAGFVALFLLSAYGWGRLGRRFLDRRIFALHSLTTILGLTFLDVLGGMLNLAHLAKGWVLPGLLLLGIIIATREIASRRPWCRRSFTPGTIPIFVALAVTMSAA